jgi:hypothetical protein
MPLLCKGVRHPLIDWSFAILWYITSLAISKASQVDRYC